MKLLKIFLDNGKVAGNGSSSQVDFFFDTGVHH